MSEPNDLREKILNLIDEWQASLDTNEDLADQILALLPVMSEDEIKELGLETLEIMPKQFEAYAKIVRKLNEIIRYLNAERKV